MATQPTTKRSATHRGQPVTALRLATAATLLTVAVSGGLLLRQGAGRQEAAPSAPATAVTAATPATPDPGLVVYLVESAAEGDLIAAITAELNRNRQSRGERQLSDEVLVQAGTIDASHYTAMLSLWQAGQGRELRVADLRGR